MPFNYDDDDDDFSEDREWRDGDSESSIRVEDFAPQILGEQSAKGGKHKSGHKRNRDNDDTILQWAVGIVIVAALLLVAMGAIVFRGAKF